MQEPKGSLWTKTDPSGIVEILGYNTYRYYNPPLCWGSYMIEVQPNTFNEYTYLGGDAYTAPVVVHNARGVVSYYYLLRDHLGNITQQVNTANTVVAEYSFDAWGRRRNPNDWSYNLTSQPELFADRGFTGHEYLKWFNLYNMNGRLYDPLVGRFLSADPVIQYGANTQNYNRYSYCLNNPLKFTDPSGYQIRKSDADAWAEAMTDRYEDFMLNRGGGTGGDWFSAYTSATREGYTGGAGAFLEEYDNQRYSSCYNGTMSFTYYTTSYEKYVEPGCSLPGITARQTRHEITINPAGQGDVLGLMKDIGTGADYASGVIGLTQIGMLEYRMSLPLSSKIGTLSYFSTTYRGLGVASKSLGFVGYAGGLSSVYLDYKSLQSGEIGLGRFGYRTGSLGLSIYTGAAIGGPWGAVGGAAVGGISVGCEYTYDNVLHPLWREVNYQIWNFENALKNGWYPGR